MCDFSVGLPLADWPAVTAALDLLRLDLSTLSLGHWSVLQSAFLGEGESELHQRSLLWSRLREDGRASISLERVRRRAAPSENPRPFSCASLYKRLEEISRLLGQAPRHQLPSHWATHFSLLLDAWGWPGERRLTSAEYQTVHRWKGALTGLGTLDPLLGEVTALKALSALRRIAEETVYQPKLSGAGMEVLGTLEAVGLDFDYLWVAGMDDTGWPAPSRPNPYLPFSLQKKYQVAHSTPERELEFARLVTQRLLRAGRHGVVSSPQYNLEQNCRPSPLFTGLEAVTPEQLDSTPGRTVHKLYLDSGQTEVVVDPGPPGLAQRETRGGTGLFKHQAACPFRAFARIRLSAYPPEKIELGLNARQRGILLHAALERLWEQVQTLDRWISAAPDMRSRFLQNAAEHGVQQMIRERPDVLTGIMIPLEKRRLVALLEEWMELESTRESFTVLSTEQRVELSFAGLNFRATLDRVDRLADGSLAVIDYKTGSPNIRDWLGDRPKEPQLPLYSVAQPGAVQAICFARVKPGKMSFQGLGAADDCIPGVVGSEFGPDGLKSWPERQAEWSEVLESLAAEFRDGRAVVDPKDGRSTCRHCGLEALCRIDEAKE